MKRSRRSDIFDDVGSDANEEQSSDAETSDVIASKGFATAFSTIMNRSLPTNVETNVSNVMAEKHELLERLDENKRLARVAKKRATGKKLEMDRAHVAKIDPLQLNNEKRLKRIATKGVVQLFNSVMAARRRQLVTTTASS